jgi:hypothetical protein
MEMSSQLYAPSALTRKRALGTKWIGGWVGLKAGGKKGNYGPTGNHKQINTIRSEQHRM